MDSSSKSDYQDLPTNRLPTNRDIINAYNHLRLNNSNKPRDDLFLALAKQVKFLFDRTSLQCLKINNIKEKIKRIKDNGDDYYFQAIACKCNKDACSCQEILKGW